MSQSENELCKDGGCSTNRSKALHRSENAVWFPFRAQAPGNGRPGFALLGHIPQIAVKADWQCLVDSHDSGTAYKFDHASLSVPSVKPRISVQTNDSSRFLWQPRLQKHEARRSAHIPLPSALCAA